MKVYIHGFQFSTLDGIIVSPWRWFTFGLSSPVSDSLITLKRPPGSWDWGRMSMVTGRRTLFSLPYTFHDPISTGINRVLTSDVRTDHHFGILNGEILISWFHDSIRFGYNPSVNWKLFLWRPVDVNSLIYCNPIFSYKIIESDLKGQWKLMKPALIHLVPRQLRSVRTRDQDIQTCLLLILWTRLSHRKNELKCFKPQK